MKATVLAAAAAAAAAAAVVVVVVVVFRMITKCSFKQNYSTMLKKQRNFELIRRGSVEIHELCGEIPHGPCIVVTC